MLYFFCDEENFALGPIFLNQDPAGSVCTVCLGPLFKYLLFLFCYFYTTMFTFLMSNLHFINFLTEVLTKNNISHLTNLNDFQIHSHIKN